MALPFKGFILAKGTETEQTIEFFDDTLTKEGCIPDAKKVGDKLTEISEAIKDVDKDKLSKQHGAENSGKLLSVDENGNTKYVDKPKPKAVYDEALRGVKIV